MTEPKIRVLIIAEAANPEWVSVPLVGWSLSDALRNEVSTHLVTQQRNYSAIKNRGLTEGRDFSSIDSEKLAKYLYLIANFIRGGTGKGWTTITAINAFSYYYFEYLVWQHFKKSIQNNEYDIVHRITPLSPTIPSLLAKKCSQSGIPFVWGPINGGVPWPKNFTAERHQEKEWLSYVRNFYKFLPGYNTTLKYSSAIIAGSRHTLEGIPKKYRALPANLWVKK